MKPLFQLLRKAALFLLVTGVVYAGTMFGLYHLRVHGHPLLYRSGDYYQGKGGLSYAKFRSFDRAKRYDVVVIGSSHAYRGYDPRIFGERGIDLFNLGTSAQTPMNSYHVLKSHVDTGNCRLVLFDLYENTMEHDGLESTSDLSRNIDSDRAALGMCLALKDPRGINLMALRWLSRSEPPRPVDGPDRSGYAERTDSLRTAPRKGQERPLALDSMQVRYLRRCIAYCTDQGLPLVFVTHYYPQASDHERHARFHALIEREIAGTGIRYIDLAYAGRVDDRDHFYDHNHLNAAGVALFNAQLLDSLSALGLLPPERR